MVEAMWSRPMRIPEAKIRARDISGAASRSSQTAELWVMVTSFEHAQAGDDDGAGEQPTEVQLGRVQAQLQRRLVAQAGEARGIDGDESEERGDQQPEQGPGERGRRAYETPCAR